MLDPSNLVEHLAFDRSYETLVRLDCVGRAEPGLAASWRHEGPALTLHLRDSARFWSNTLVTATDVIASWHDAAAATGNRLVRVIADSSHAIDDRTLEIRVQRIAPEWLASPSFAVTRRSDGGFAEGTGRSALRESRAGVRDGARRYTLSPSPGGLAEIFTVQRAAARDLIDAGGDLLITNDAAVTNYARSRADFTDVPLEWDRTWVLVVPARRDVASTAEPDSSAWLAFRSALARDLIGEDARAATTPSWFGTSVVCAGPPSLYSGAARPLARTTVAYQTDEPIARRIAERLVALAGFERGRAGATLLRTLVPALGSTEPAPAAVGLEPEDFGRALIERREYAFVLDLPSHSLSPCADVVHPLGSLPWIVDEAGVLARAAIVPLVETRWRALIRNAR